MEWKGEAPRWKGVGKGQDRRRMMAGESGRYAWDLAESAHGFHMMRRCSAGEQGGQHRRKKQTPSLKLTGVLS